VGTETLTDDERRRAPRHELNLPAQTHANGSDFHDIEIVDISATGMQVRAGAFDVFRRMGYVPDKKDRLRISMVARLAWAEPEEDGGFTMGWEFVQEDGEGQAS
jgi:hypothetical protein